MSTTEAIPSDGLQARIRKAIARGLLTSAEPVPNTEPPLVVMTTPAGDQWVGRYGAQAHCYLTGLHQGSWAEQHKARR